MHFANLVQAIDDLNCKLAVGRVCDVLLLDRRIYMDDIFLCQVSMQTNAHLKNPVYAFSANALTKVNQFRAVAGQFLLEFFQTAKCLVVRIALLLQYHRFVTQIL